MSNIKDSTSNYGTSIYAFIARTATMTVAVLVAAWILPGVHIASFWAALGAAIVIGLLNNLVRPGIVVATLPLTMSSMGCFLFIINAFIILLTSVVIHGFNVKNFFSALLFSLLLTAINYLLELPQRRRQQIPFQQKEAAEEDGTFDSYEEVTEEKELPQENNHN